MKIIEAILIILLIIALGFGVSVMIELMPAPTLEFKEVNSTPSISKNSLIVNSTQFYTEMRYPDRKISYYLSDKCDSKKRSDMINAFSYLSQETLLNFYESSSDKAEIEIACSDISPLPEDKTHFIAGEGGPRDIVDTGLYHVIFSGKISLYRGEKCDEPKIALHELLHALGFDHNNNPKSILYPITSCDEKLDDYLIEEINRLYLVDSLPDLAITNVKAQKTGRYLSFNIEILNQGLKDSGKIAIKVYADNQLTKEIEVEGIQIGFKKIITVDNLKIPSSTKEIDFDVSLSDNSLEVSNKNNEIELTLEDI